MIKHFAARLAGAVLAFPSGRRHACGHRGEPSPTGGLCAACYGDVAVKPKNACAVCARPLDFDYEIQTGADYACGQCRADPPPYDGLCYALEYEGPARELVHKFKFAAQPGLAASLAELGKDTLAPWLEGLGDVIVVPVPLSARRLFTRGYNPAYLLARRFAGWTGAEATDGVMRRVRNTRPQFELSPDERAANVKGAFAVAAPERVKGRRVVLFDDIYTTGATAKECAKTLDKAGAKEVWVAALCRAG